MSDEPATPDLAEPVRSRVAAAERVAEERRVIRTVWFPSVGDALKAVGLEE